MPTRPCWVEISTQILEDNFRFLKSIASSDAELLAIVKANAYGHGLELCAPAVVRGGARWLGVTSVEEGVLAREACEESVDNSPRILVIGGVFPGQGSEVIRHGLTPVVWEPWHLDELESAAREAGAGPGALAVHLEIDTGMSRQGASPESVGAMLKRLMPGSPLRLEGVMTHLFAADEADRRVTGEQLVKLEKVLNQIAGAGLFADWLNVGNSAALVAGEVGPIAELAARHGMKAMLRPGLALYGLLPRFDPDFGGNEPSSMTRTREAIKPVLEWKSQVVSVTHVEPGTTVGYNGTFVATEPMRLALVAAGYADGLDRKLGNRFSLLVRGARAPIVGRISMDQTVIDVTEIEGVKPGDEVVMIGSQGSDRITAFDHAVAAGTIPWEVFTRIGARVERRAV